MQKTDKGGLCGKMRSLLKDEVSFLLFQHNTSSYFKTQCLYGKPMSLQLNDSEGTVSFLSHTIGSAVVDYAGSSSFFFFFFSFFSCLAVFNSNTDCLSVPLNPTAPNVTVLSVCTRHAEQANCLVCFHVCSQWELPEDGDELCFGGLIAVVAESLFEACRRSICKHSCT